MIVKPSASGYTETLQALLEAIEKRGLTLFAQIDHAGGARAAGLELADEQVLLFGNARSGTPLMQSDPRIGIELPLRMLLWREGEEVLLGYRDPRELQNAYAVSGQGAALERMASLLDELSTEVTGQSRTGPGSS